MSEKSQYEAFSVNEAEPDSKGVAYQYDDRDEEANVRENLLSTSAPMRTSTWAGLSTNGKPRARVSRTTSMPEGYGSDDDTKSSGSRKSGAARMHMQTMMSWKRASTKKKKNLNMADASSFWPGVKHLRQLFQMWDKDGDGTLTLAELKSGLEQLGFEIKNVQSVAKLYKTINKNEEHGIREEAFISVFRKLNRESLQQQLLKASNDGPSKGKGEERPWKAQVTDIGIWRNRSVMQQQELTAQNLGPVLEAGAPSQWDKSVRWIDIHGFNDKVMELVASELSLPVTVLEDVQLDQRAKIEYHSQSNLVQVVTHALFLRHVPVIKTERLLDPDFDPESEEAIPKLAPVSSYENHKPDLDVVQVHILIINENTVLTFRKHDAGDASGPLYDELYTTLKQRTETSLPVFVSAKLLACELLDEITGSNWVVRYSFKAWKIALETDIRATPREFHLQQLLDMKQAALRCVRIARAGADVFYRLTMEHPDFALPSSSAVNPPPSAIPNSTSSLNLASLAPGSAGPFMTGNLSTQATTSAFLASSSSSAVTAAASNNSHAHDDLNHRQVLKCFQDHMEEMKTISDSWLRLLDQFSLTTQLTEELSAFYRTQQNDRMTRALYFLTVVTTLMAPLQVFSSVYGMNFDDLPELHFKYGYALFWVVNICIIVVMVYFFKRKNMVFRI